MNTFTLHTTNENGIDNIKKYDNIEQALWDAYYLPENAKFRYIMKNGEVVMLPSTLHYIDMNKVARKLWL